MGDLDAPVRLGFAAAHLRVLTQCIIDVEHEGRVELERAAR
ncbi:hypothetical protein [Streptomyces sp. NRRL S-1448]|nr:hypothetical protein [Streptomyces sp. NRRL S-1448]